MEAPRTAPPRGWGHRAAGTRVLLLELAAAGLLPLVAAVVLAWFAAGGGTQPLLNALAGAVLLLAAEGGRRRDVPRQGSRQERFPRVAVFVVLMASGSRVGWAWPCAAPDAKA